MEELIASQNESNIKIKQKNINSNQKINESISSSMSLSSIFIEMMNMK